MCNKVIDARMEVEYHHDAATGKSFRIVTQSGSKMLCEKVLKRAVESVPALNLASASDAQAVVILSAGAAWAPEYGNDVPDAWLAAAVTHQGEHLVSFDRDFRKLLGRGQFTLLSPT